MKARARQLKNEITAVYYAYRHPAVKLLPKLIMIFTVGYALSPVDLIPDFIPVLGYLDDLIILPALIALSIRLIPKEVMEQSRQKAIEEPLKLKKNWFFGLLFISIWLVLAAVIVLSFINR